MKINTLAIVVMSALSLSSAVYAAETTVNGGTVHFTGEIVNAACAVSTDSSDQTVKLGQYRTAEFTATGDTTTKVPFNIVLNDCDTSVATQASVAFSGSRDDTDSTLLAVSAGGDNTTAATGVGIEILDNSSLTLTPDGSVYSTAQTLNNGTNTIPFSVRYKSTADSVTAGKADADATFVMKYE